MKLSSKSINEIKTNLEEARKMVMAYEFLLQAHEAPEAPKQASQIGITEAIKRLLANSKEGMSSTQVIEALGRSGVTVAGNTKLGARTHIELNRLKKIGAVKKKGDKFLLS